ncbi:PREDICTED: uncharacterized protein LOC109332479 [Lupinus angustifolius]|uniref:uncharacterized protein LOC109332477 n=1 Tax=Lupinus angustifolius TaxID=3871 RepID=UPI00092E5AB6|nr:PREDICTED: uncharacterized protein LOC109332477 [Lupinus angustifolius]XP_019423005.1 PREDICTED: uncharacterized protein LOC109332479 [Lupinus angustifolius]
MRARVVCANPDCGWIAFCSRDIRFNTYQLKTFNPEHNYCRTFQNKAASRDWVAKNLEVRLVTQPHLRRTQDFNLMKEDYMFHLEKKKLSRALKQAREATEGSGKKQFGQLWDYLEEIHKTNTGSTDVIEMLPIPESPPMFNRLFISLNACREGFKNECIPLIALNGCFLKGYYGGSFCSQDMYGWNFVSDQQKGLESAIVEVMPSAHHRNCVLHI